MEKKTEHKPDNIYPNLGIVSWKQNFVFNEKTFEGTIGQADKNSNIQIIGPISTQGAERVLITKGSLKHRAPKENNWQNFSAGDVIIIPANSQFEWILGSDQIEYECIFLEKPVKKQIDHLTEKISHNISNTQKENM